jgi:hypothetical protein
VLVYGDIVHSESVREKLARLSDALRKVQDLPAGLDRHVALVAAFIEAGELAQGIADAAFAERGEDASWPAAKATMALLMRVAQAVRTSWESGFTRAGPWPAEEIEAVAESALPDLLHTKRAEGFSYYALYPEAYLSAAASLPLGPPTRVIGIRSIGVALGAIVAAALGTPAPWTLRPVGDPFRRRVAVSEDFAAELLADPACRFVIVDEGPGLSGSTFGAVADFLEDRGVEPSRIHFFPSHPGPPGAQASGRDRDRWDRSRRHSASFETLLLQPPCAMHRLEGWAAGLVGAPTQRLDDISGGRWRALRFTDAATWPAIHPHQERRKFLLRTARDTWLLKFTGLGRHGMEQVSRARMLHSAGFTPEVAGYCHGFLVERWIGDAAPLDLCADNRNRIVAHIGRYLAFRGRRFPAAPGEGATMEALWHMARHNAEQALGEGIAERMDRWKLELPGLEQRIRRVWTDNRLHVWEWLQRPDGTILKTDALDHATAHDLIGCQDLAWDVVGASIELGLSLPEQGRVCAVLEQEAGQAVDPVLLAFLLPCYLAFQLGYYTMAADASAGWPEEMSRARITAARYAERLRNALTGESA